MRYCEPPSRPTRRMTLTSSVGSGRAPSALSNTSSTSAVALARRPSLPAKITSCIDEPRTVVGLCSPSAQTTASARLLLPLPLGPMITATPGSKTSSVCLGNDLKPRTRRRLRCTLSRPPPRRRRGRRAPRPPARQVRRPPRHRRRRRRCRASAPSPDGSSPSAGLRRVRRRARRDLRRARACELAQRLLGGLLLGALLAAPDAVAERSRRRPTASISNCAVVRRPDDVDDAVAHGAARSWRGSPAARSCGRRSCCARTRCARRRPRRPPGARPRSRRSRRGRR